MLKEILMSYSQCSLNAAFAGCAQWYILTCNLGLPYFNFVAKQAPIQEKPAIACILFRAIP